MLFWQWKNNQKMTNLFRFLQVARNLLFNSRHEMDAKNFSLT